MVAVYPTGMSAFQNREVHFSQKVSWFMQTVPQDRKSIIIYSVEEKTTSNSFSTGSMELSQSSSLKSNQMPPVDAF